MRCARHSGVRQAVPMTGAKPEADLHPFLRGLNERWLAAIGRCSVQSRFAAGRFVFRTGEPATRIHLLQSGRVGLLVGCGKDPETQVAIMGPGELLTCPCSTEAQKWQFSVQCFDEVTTQSIFIKRLRDLCQTDHELACELNHRFLLACHEQLTAARRQIAEVSQLALDSQRMALESIGRQQLVNL